MKRTKQVKTLEKKPTTRVKWPLKKFINKFFIYNIFLTLGIAMLIMSIVCQGVFHGDNAKITSNIVVSALVMAAGFGGGLVYSILLSKKGEEPLEQDWANLNKWFFWVPVLGMVFNKIWKHKENKLSYGLKLKDNPNFKKPRTKLPNAVSIIFAALICMVFVIWILYLTGVLIPGETDTIPGILDIFLNPLKGFAGYSKQTLVDGQLVNTYIKGAGAIIIFLLLFNGAMTLVNDAHAIEAGVGSLLAKLKGKEFILIPILMLILAICGSTFNMCEQLLPLFLVMIPMMYAAGYDAMTGFILLFISAGVGVMGSTVNPVLIGISIDSIPDAYRTIGMMDGIVWRLVMFAGLTITSIVCTMLYARKVKKNPMKSCVYMSQQEFKERYTFDKDALPPMTKKRKWTLIVFGIAFIIMILGFIDWYKICGFTGFIDANNWLAQNCPFFTSMGAIGSWNMLEAGMVFFIAAIIIGAINWKGASHWFSVFYKGCKDFIGVAFIIATAKGLSFTLVDSGLNAVIANGLGGVLQHVPPIGAMLMIFLVITLLTIFIPSCSGLASAMMPMIGSTVGGLIESGVSTISMSGAVTTFAAGMGWMNIVTPTSMALPFLEVSKMELGDYFKAAWKQILAILIVGVGLLCVGCYMPASIF